MPKTEQLVKQFARNNLLFPINVYSDNNNIQFADIMMGEIDLLIRSLLAGSK